MIAASILVGAIAPAAADAKIGLSMDGVTFSSALSGPLFGSQIRWVPGDERRRTFYVRNQGAERAVMAVDFVGRDVNDLLATGELTISASADGGPTRAVSSAGTRRLITDVEVPAAGVSRVDVDVSFDPASDNRSQIRGTEFDFAVHLTQDEVLAANVADRAAEGGGILPDTGSPASWTLIIGSVFVVGGLITTRKQREIEDSHV